MVDRARSTVRVGRVPEGGTTEPLVLFFLEALDPSRGRLGGRRPGADRHAHNARASAAAATADSVTCCGHVTASQPNDQVQVVLVGVRRGE